MAPSLLNSTVFPDWAADGSDAALADAYIRELELRIKPFTRTQ
ncbi:hypothetical protein [Herbaspirillum huttiense]|nr:hypothetical protein [Herbaspirillum huttiense]